MFRFCLAITWLGLATFPTYGQEWPRFRGPNGSGLGQANIPTEWTEQAFAWKRPLPGTGNSSPVLWGDRLFLTAGDDMTGTRIVLAIDITTGDQTWKQEFNAPSYKMHKKNTVATATPCVDADRLYTTWGTPESYAVIALTHDGQFAWTADLGPFNSGHGFGPSPIRVGDLLILMNDQDDGGSVIALDAESGEQRWITPRRTTRASFSTPCIFESPGKDPLIILTEWQQGVTALDPMTGQVQWEQSIFDTSTNERAIASPIVAGDTILATCGFVTGKKHFVAIRPTAAGDPKEIWRVERAVSYLPTPLAHGELVFFCSEKGIATCVRADNGEELWQERLGGQFSASPVWSNGRLFCAAEDGTVHVIAAGEEFEHLAENRLDEAIIATPAIARDRIFVRTEKHLVCVLGR